MGGRTLMQPHLLTRDQECVHVARFFRHIPVTCRWGVHIHGYLARRFCRGGRLKGQIQESLAYLGCDVESP